MGKTGNVNGENGECEWGKRGIPRFHMEVSMEVFPKDFVNALLKALMKAFLKGFIFSLRAISREGMQIGVIN